MLVDPKIMNEAEEIVFLIFIRSLVVVLSIIVAKRLQNDSIFEVLFNNASCGSNIVLDSLILSDRPFTSVDIDMMGQIVTVDKEDIRYAKSFYKMLQHGINQFGRWVTTISGPG